MKRILFYTLLVIAAVSCARVNDNDLRTGDLVFVSLRSDYFANDSTSMGSAIASSTGNGEMDIIHVAIAEVEGDSIWIVDATIRHGVDRHPLDTFLTDFMLRDGSLPTFTVKRVEGVDAQAAVEKAKTFCGLPYDVAFLPDNGAMYCTELVRESYLGADGQPVFENAPMNFLAPDGTMPIYWTTLFGSINSPIPQGIPGTNPQSMSESNLLKDVQVRKELWQIHP